MKQNILKHVPPDFCVNIHVNTEIEERSSSIYEKLALDIIRSCDPQESTHITGDG